MLITRDIINKNVLFLDQLDYHISEEYSYEEISLKIDFFKNYLLDLGCKKGESVLIGYACGIDQTALIFAVSELGLNFIVNDYRIDYKIVKGNTDFLDTKSKILMPIDYYFDNDTSDFKKKYLSKISKRTITKAELSGYNNYGPNHLILATPDDILMKCTSSGTTGTPKLVRHTHEFIYNISKRNSIFFNNTVGIAYNLNHGSSLATYYLPSLTSPEVKKIINLPIHFFRGGAGGYITYVEKVHNILQEFDHLMVPYESQLNRIIESYDLPNIMYYTLSSISQDLYKKRDRFKDVISIFGCNETSGPIFINRTSFNDFRPDVYYKVDNYYELRSISPLIVFLKEYNIELNTNDVFIPDLHGFRFNGRKDLVRINGINIQKDSHYNILKKHSLDADFIYDTVYNKIYLAIWADTKCEIQSINDELVKISDGAHTISKYERLNKDDFVQGVKLDQEYLRCYFREE